MKRLTKLGVLLIVALLLFSTAYKTIPVQAQGINRNAIETQLFYLFASGNKEIQDQGHLLIQSLGLPQETYDQLASLTRETYLQLLDNDRQRLGLPSEGQNDPAKGDLILSQMDGKLQQIIGNNYKGFLTSLERKYNETNSRSWVEKNVKPQSTTSSGTVLPLSSSRTYYIWATSFSQSSFPPQWPNYSNYVAVPDAYVKFANWYYYGSTANDSINQIPSNFRPYYSGYVDAPYEIFVSKDNANFIGTIVSYYFPRNFYFRLLHNNS